MQFLHWIVNCVPKNSIFILHNHRILKVWKVSIFREASVLTQFNSINLFLDGLQLATWVLLHLPPLQMTICLVESGSSVFSHHLSCILLGLSSILCCSLFFCIYHAVACKLTVYVINRNYEYSGKSVCSDPPQTCRRKWRWLLFFLPEAIYWTNWKWVWNIIINPYTCMLFLKNRLQQTNLNL